MKRTTLAEIFEIALLNRLAFTVLELLVVIFIIGVLIILLVPSLERAKKRSWIGHCVQNGDLERCRNGVADGDIRPGDYPRLVQIAAQYGHLEICRYFVNELHMPVSKDSRYVFPAMQSGKNEVLQYFLIKGAVVDPVAKNDSKQTLLHVACIGGNIDFCKTLLENKAALEAVDNRGMTPLWHAAENGRDDAFKLLVDAGAVVDTKLTLSNGAYLIHLAARGGSGTICRFLLDKGVNVNLQWKTNYCRQPIHLAAMADRPDACRVLIEAGTDVNARDTQNPKEGGFLPLMYATDPKQIQTLKLLIFAGAEHSVHRRYLFGTLIQIAVEGGDVELCQFLYKEGASLNDHDYVERNSLLHIAARNGHVDVCKWLLEVGMDINIRNDRRETPLILTAQRNRVETCKFLLKNGADIDAIGIQGTALQVAQIDTPRWPGGKDNAALLALLQSRQKPRQEEPSSSPENTEEKPQE